MSSKESEDLIPISSRARRPLWSAMKQAAVMYDVTLQDLLEEAFVDVLQKKAAEHGNKSPAQAGKGRVR